MRPSLSVLPCGSPTKFCTKQNTRPAGTFNHVLHKTDGYHVWRRFKIPTSDCTKPNILNFWISNKSRQVILLSQDEEIDVDFYKRIKKHVSATFLLTHEDVGDGMGRTTVIPNKYFGGVA